MAKTPKSGKKEAKVSKTPKSAKEKKGDGPIKIKYGIFGINLEGKHLKPIVNQFKQALSEHSRRAILGVNRDEIITDILTVKEKRAKEKPAATPKGKKDKKSENDKEPKDNKGKKGNKDKKDTRSETDDKKEPTEEKKNPVIAIEEIKPIDPEIFVLDEKNFNEFFGKMREHIERSVLKSESIANLLKSKEGFDLLKYWEAMGDGKALVDDALKKGKGKTTADDDKKGKKGGKGGESEKQKGKDKEEKKGKKKESDKEPKKGKKKVEEKQEVENPEESECQLQELPIIKLKEKFWSKIQPRIENKEVKLQFIEDHPIDTLDAFIILLGSFSNDIYFELMKKNLPLKGISTFFPNSSIDSTENTSETLKEIKELWNSEKTKDIRIFTDYINVMSECKVVRYKKQIYDELSWHVYDTELMKRHHQIYVENTKVYDVEEKTSFPKDVDILHGSNLPEWAPDEITVVLYLDTLIEMVHDNMLGTIDYFFVFEENEDENEHIAEEEKLTEDEINIFITNYCGISVIEDTNTVLKKTLASEVDLLHYQKWAEIIRMVTKLDKIWNNFSETTPLNLDYRQSVGLFYFVDNGDMNTFCEPLTTETFCQYFNMLLNDCDHVEFLYISGQNNINISFYHSRNVFFETNIKTVIPTLLCFRDYCEYLAPSLKDWGQEQELLYNQRKALDRVNREYERPEPPIPDEDFFRISLLKYNKLEKQKSLPHVATNIDKERSGKKEKGKEVKGKSPRGNKEEKVKSPKAPQKPPAEDVSPILDSEISDVKPTFLSYNLGDEYLELNSYQGVYRSIKTNLKLIRDDWTKRNKSFRLILQTAGNYIFYSREIPTNYYPATLRIETKNQIKIDFIHYSLPLFTSGGEEAEIQEISEDGNEEESFPHITINWPSLLTIKNVWDVETKSISEIQQTSLRRSINETKRLMFSDGTVIVFRKNSKIFVFTANGTIYETGPPPITRTEDYILKISPNYIKSQNKHQNEIDYIKRFHDVLDSENFLLTTAEGYNFVVKNGQIITENHKFLNIEWFDFVTGERYSSREDGVKTLTSDSHFICYYPDGTMITSYTEVYFLYAYFNDDLSSESFVLFSEEESALYRESALHVAKSVIKELLNIAVDEIFSYFNVSYLIQNECYATVRFDKEKDFLNNKVVIYSPDGVNVTFMGNRQALIDLSGELYLSCDKDECNILADADATKMQEEYTKNEDNSDTDFMKQQSERYFL